MFFFMTAVRKLTRYSNLIESISSVMLWWKALSQVDKANVDNVNQMVTSCEEIFGRERDAWMSTTMKVARLHKENEDDGEDKHK